MPLGQLKYCWDLIATKHSSRMQKKDGGFTHVELVVSISVLAVIVVSIARLISEATGLTDSASRQIEADGQVRRLLDRIAIDLNQMVRRADIDFYLKTSANAQPGNDQLAFYSEGPGYYPSSGSQSSISLVGYRINAQNNMERLGKGLVWSGVSSGSSPLVFLPQTIATTWPTAVNNATDADYEIVATNVFRFEYYYWLTNGSYSETPWDAAAGHNAASGMRDVVAIAVAFASIDSKSRNLLSDAQLRTIAASMSDFAPSPGPETLVSQWQNALNGTSGLPPPALSAIRLHQHWFELARKP